MDDPVGKGEIDRSTLITLGYSPEELDARIVRQLNAIEKVVSNVQKTRKKAQETLREDPLSIRRVAEKTGLSRTTIHTNPILKGYLLARKSTVLANDDEAKITELEKDLEESCKIIEALRRRDAEMMILRRRISELEKQRDDLERFINHELNRTVPNLSVERDRPSRGIVRFDEIK